jgi:uncharacterized protein (TIGR00645 family)
MPPKISAPPPISSARSPAERLEFIVENGIFASRWLLAPLYVGLALSLFVVLAVFAREMWHLVAISFSPSLKSDTVILLVLSLIDLSLLANLILIVVFSGFESFVSKMENQDHPDRPGWMGKIDFGGLKLKLVASIAAISAIQLLKVFMQETPPSNDRVFWLVVIHLTFVLSGVMLAVMDLITAKAKTYGYEGD